MTVISRGSPLKHLSIYGLSSHRGHQLVISVIEIDRPLLTVELYEKWYTLFLVHPDGRIEEVDYPDDIESCPADVSPCRDHVPNPKVVANFARIHGYDIDPLAYELLVGRWVIDCEDDYPPFFSAPP